MNNGSAPNKSKNPLQYENWRIVMLPSHLIKQAKLLLSSPMNHLQLIFNHSHKLQKRSVFIDSTKLDNKDIHKSIYPLMIQTTIEQFYSFPHRSASCTQDPKMTLGISEKEDCIDNDNEGSNSFSIDSPNTILSSRALHELSHLTKNIANVLPQHGSDDNHEILETDRKQSMENGHEDDKTKADHQHRGSGINSKTKLSNSAHLLLETSSNLHTLANSGLQVNARIVWEVVIDTIVDALKNDIPPLVMTMVAPPLTQILIRMLLPPIMKMFTKNIQHGVLSGELQQQSFSSNFDGTNTEEEDTTEGSSEPFDMTEVLKSIHSDDHTRLDDARKNNGLYTGDGKMGENTEEEKKKKSTIVNISSPKTKISNDILDSDTYPSKEHDGLLKDHHSVDQHASSVNTSSIRNKMKRKAEQKLERNQMLMDKLYARQRIVGLGLGPNKTMEVGSKVKDITQMYLNALKIKTANSRNMTSSTNSQNMASTIGDRMTSMDRSTTIVKHILNLDEENDIHDGEEEQNASEALEALKITPAGSSTKLAFLETSTQRMYGFTAGETPSLLGKTTSPGTQQEASYPIALSTILGDKILTQLRSQILPEMVDILEQRISDTLVIDITRETVKRLIKKLIPSLRRILLKILPYSLTVHSSHFLTKILLPVVTQSVVQMVTRSMFTKTENTATILCQLCQKEKGVDVSSFTSMLSQSSREFPILSSSSTVYCGGCQDTVRVLQHRGLRLDQWSQKYAAEVNGWASEELVIQQANALNTLL
eukprot:g1210.t1